MFEDVLLESGGRMKTHRAATTFASLLLQFAFVGLLLLMPLIFTEALPAARWSDNIRVPAPAGVRERPTELVPTPPSSGETSEITREGVLLAPSQVPERIANIIDEGPPSIGITGPGGSGALVPGFGDPNSLIRHAIPSDFTPPPVVRPPERLAVSGGVMQGFLIHKVTPEYPRIARIMRVQGEVVLHAAISTEGRIERLRVVSGPLQLRAAAEQAVRQWRYRPYLLNGQAIEVETQITVKFILGSDSH